MVIAVFDSRTSCKVNENILSSNLIRRLHADSNSQTQSTLVVKPTVLRGDIFTEDVTTCLPYRRVSRSIEDVLGVKITEDAIVLVSEAVLCRYCSLRCYV